MRIDRSKLIRTEFNISNILWWTSHFHLIILGMAGWKMKKMDQDGL